MLVLASSAWAEAAHLKTLGGTNNQRAHMRVVYGFLAIFPFLLIGYALIVLARTNDFWPDWFWFGTPIVIYAGMGVYLWSVWHNPSVPREKRALWTALIFFGNICVLPFYFAFYVWPKAARVTTTTTSDTDVAPN